MFKILGNYIVTHSVIHKQTEVAYEADQANVLVLSHNKEIAGFLVSVNLKDRVIIHLRPRYLKAVCELDKFVATNQIGNVAIFVAPHYRNKGGMRFLFQNLLVNAKQNCVSRVDLIDIQNHWLLQKLTSLLMVNGFPSVRQIYPEQNEGGYNLIAIK